MDAQEAVSWMEQGIRAHGNRGLLPTERIGTDERGFFLEIYGKKYRITNKEIHNFKVSATETYDYTRDVLIHSDDFRPYIADPMEKYVVVRIRRSDRQASQQSMSLGYSKIDEKNTRNFLFVDYSVSDSVGMLDMPMTPEQHGYDIMIKVLEFLRIKYAKPMLDGEHANMAELTADCLHRHLETKYGIRARKRQGFGFSFEIRGTEYDCVNEDMLDFKTEDGTSFSPATDIMLCRPDFTPGDRGLSGRIAWIRTRSSWVESWECKGTSLLNEGKKIGIAIAINPRKDMDKWKNCHDFDSAFDEALGILAGKDINGFTVSTLSKSSPKIR